MLDYDVIEPVLITAAVLLAAYLMLLAAIRLTRPLKNVSGQLRRALASPFTATFEDHNHEDRRHGLEDEVRRALGQSDPWGDRERADIVHAAMAAQEITTINRLLRDSVKKCLQVHWSVARGLGATHMSDSARHPLSQQQRQRVIGLSDLLSRNISTYPLLSDSGELIQLHLSLQWVPATCAACTYWTTSVSDAPRVCVTAKAMFGKAPGGKGASIIDGEIIDDCESES